LEYGWELELTLFATNHRMELAALMSVRTLLQAIQFEVPIINHA
jgi:hypothetical protein